MNVYRKSAGDIPESVPEGQFSLDYHTPTPEDLHGLAIGDDYADRARWYGFQATLAIVGILMLLGIAAGLLLSTML